MTNNDVSDVSVKGNTEHKQRFDALWWAVIVIPPVWWIVALVLVMMKSIEWNVFLTTGFLVQGIAYIFQSLMRMVFRRLGQGYSKGHFAAFLVIGIIWVVLGIILAFVTQNFKPLLP